MDSFQFLSVEQAYQFWVSQSAILVDVRDPQVIVLVMPLALFI